MTRTLIACVVALAVGVPVEVRAETPARQMYEAAVAREKTVRAAWDQAGTVATPDTVAARRVRAVVAAYRAVVWRYPASGYCDNALWQAAALAEDLFARSQQGSDRQTAVRLFQFLAREYPASSFAARAADRARHLLTASSSSTAGGAAKAGEPSRANALEAPLVRPAGKAPVPSGAESPRVVSEPAASRGTAPAATAPLRPAAAVSFVRAIRRTVLPEVVRISIELDREVIFHQERVDNPARLLFDLLSTRPVTALRDANWAYQNDVVRHIRIGRHPNDTTRVVLDLDGVSRYTVVTLYNPYRILIDCERVVAPSRVQPATANLASARGNGAPATTVQKRVIVPATTSNATAPATAAPAAAAVPVEKKPTSTPPVPTLADQPRSEAAAKSRADDDAPEPGTREPVSKRPGKPSASEKSPEKDGPTASDRNRFSMARQLGLGIARIVIDPGHGGRDPGAEGPNGSEAEIVLDIGLRLEKALLKQPGVDVVLTRRTDVFVPLEQRTQIANREQADLFLSIHANASRNQDARGIESYYLNFASNPDAEAVAARENAASERTMNSLTDIVKAITLNNKLDESKDFAGLVQQSMVRRLRATNKSLKNLGVKQAPFVVLIGASMPSVLAEVSFVTNKREGQLLDTEAYRQRIADALADAVLRYKRGLKNANAPAEH